MLSHSDDFEHLVTLHTDNFSMVNVCYIEIDYEITILHGVLEKYTLLELDSTRRTLKIKLTFNKGRVL